MKITTLKLISSALCAIALFGATNVLATAYTSTNTVSGIWNSATTWNPNGVPGSGDTVAISNSAPVLVSDPESVASITLQKGATLTLGTGGNLTVGGTIIQSGGSSGTSTVTLAGGSGTLNLNAAAAAFTSVTLTPGTAGSTVNYGASGATVYAAAYDNLTLSGGGTVTVNSTTTAINLLMTGATAFSNGANKLASITGSVILTNTAAFTVTGNNAETIGGGVTLNGTSTFTLNANTTVGGNFTVNAGCFYYNNNGNAGITIGGNVFVAGVFGLATGANNASTVTLTGQGGTISGGGTLTNQVLVVNGSYTILSGTTVSVGNKNAGISGLLGGSGSLTDQGTLIITYSQAIGNSVTLAALSCSPTNSTVVLIDSNGGATTVPPLAYDNLTLDATAGSASAFNLGGSGLGIGGNLTFGGTSGATALVSAWPAGGSVSGQVVFNSTKGITFPSTFSIGGLAQSAGTVTVPANGTLTVTGSGAGAFTTTGGLFVTAAGSSVVFTGEAPVINGTVTNSFVNLVIDGTATNVVDTALLVVTNALTIAAGGSLDVTALTGYTLSKTQTVNNAGTILGSLVTAANSTAEISAETGAGYGTNTISGSLTLDGTNSINLNLSATALAGNDLLVVGGTLTLNNTVFNLAAPGAGASLDPANNYTLVSAGAISGTPVLNWVPGYAPANANLYSLVVNGGTIVLQNSSLGAPATPPVLAAANNAGVLTLSWNSTAYPGYAVQAQTNDLGAGFSTNWVNVDGASSPFTVTVDPTQPAVFYRLAQP